MPSVIKYDINHTTSYKYEENISSCIMSLCMQPRDHGRQSVREFFIRTAPATAFSVEFDSFGNRLHYFDIHHPHNQLEITVAAKIEHAINDRNPDDIEVPTEAWKELEEIANDWEMWEFLQHSSLTEVSSQMNTWLATYPYSTDDDPFSRLKGLAQFINESFSYVPGSTHVDSTIDHFLASKAGVCQDYAHLMIATARSWGIPSRYVSGYLYDLDEENRLADNATHAWVECWLPQLGWMPFDPTNAKIDDDNLITVALGRDYSDVAPSRGITYGGGRSELEVGVSVQKSVEESSARSGQRLGMQQ